MTLAELAVDRDSDVPLGTQLAWRLRALVATGRLGPGERLPGVRELAGAAGVNVNTVRSVYARLEEQGLLRSEHGRGTFVAPRAAEQADLARVAADAAQAARNAGLDTRDLATALYSGADLSPSSAPEEGDGPAVRRALKAEIAELEDELVRLDRGAELPARPPSAAGRILSAAELRDVRDALAERLSQLRDERAQERRRVYAQRAAELSTPPPRTWRHAGVWTGKARPGVVWTGR
jgi:DNA-binding transcriptional regulator YhcF (GntR family)